MGPNEHATEQIDAGQLIEHLTREIASLHLRIAVAEQRLAAEQAKHASNGGADA